MSVRTRDWMHATDPALVDWSEELTRAERELAESKRAIEEDLVPSYLDSPRERRRKRSRKGTRRSGPSCWVVTTDVGSYLSCLVQHTSDHQRTCGQAAP